ncbi:MAG: ABC transporter substrate-binding protein [Lachnospiraceae bacterium]|nr:ABC transporter substrate-binding protein [Lachnospiraceae bacterium]
MRIRIKIFAIACIVMIGLSGFSKCGSPSSVIIDNNSSIIEDDVNQTSRVIQEADISESLTYVKELDREYANKFRVFYYEDGYVLLMTTEDNARFLIVPEGKEIPEDIDEDVCVIERPVENMYIVASAVMDMFASLDGIDSIKYSGKKEEDWYIKEAAEAMQEGRMIYAGKYSKPDYEMIVSGDCSLIVENTMIFHSPEVKEKFEEFGIPVMVEYSNYEDHPLGRVEWVKFFGALLGEDELAGKIYEEQRDIVNSVKDSEPSNKTIAYFYITSNNLIQVRKSSDYIPKMIELAGGKYIYENLEGEEENQLVVNMSVEQFYNDAKDADIIIYNSSIDGGVKSLEELYAKSELLKDFKAVKEGNVWCTTNDMYQQSLSVGYMIEDINNVLNDKDDNLHYLFRLE